MQPDLKHLYAQVIDDGQGKTLVFASSLSKEFKGQKVGKNLAAAKKVGELIAQKGAGGRGQASRFRPRRPRVIESWSSQEAVGAH